MSYEIPAHGGTLVHREAEGKQREDLAKKAGALKKLQLSEREIADLEMIATGALSPLTGFMTRENYDAVLAKMHLSCGLPWTIPITKQISEEVKKTLKLGEEVTLHDSEGRELAIMQVEDIFPHDKKKQALEIYGTEDAAHPGVAAVYAMGDWFVGGPVWLLQRPAHKDFADLRLSPKETRAFFRQKNWRRIVAFQTRNPIHRAHEYIQKCALEIVDGLLLHPLVGETKGDDVPARIRVKSYNVILEKYYPKDRVLLAAFPAAMRYAGPREAIFHAIARKNYGCTHFIVGRDHAGVNRPGGGGYYGSFDAHYIFDEFEPAAIGITPLFFDFTFFCKTCGGMASFKSCPHDSSHHVSLSGTKVREMLRAGQIPPPEFSRAEVAQILIEGMKEQPSYQI
ncbi:MAG: sulfate adenylyltransferase [Candidatus Omnitrophica bacterium]|nr:sulfate adenylyltransferase [Candidatus Omnitrophota bacterium]